MRAERPREAPPQRTRPTSAHAQATPATMALSRAASRLLAGWPGAMLATPLAACMHSGAALGEPQRGGYMGLGHPAQEQEDQTRILVTGAGGQVGAELVPYLR